MFQQNALFSIHRIHHYKNYNIFGSEVKNESSVSQPRVTVNAMVNLSSTSEQVMNKFHASNLLIHIIGI